MSNRVNGAGCPYCEDRRALTGYNDLSTIDPELSLEWSPNNELSPEEVRRSSPAPALWNCPTCHGEYSYIIAAREVGDDACPYCRGKKILTGYNDLVTVDPELSLEWSPNNKLGPEEVRRSSPASALWNCPTCHGEYSYIIAAREVGDDACPYCRGKKILTGYNDLVTVDPELSLEWSPNNELGPEEVRRNSPASALWNCPTCHGEYSSIIAVRKVGDDSCPYCSERKPSPGYNTLQAKHPDLIAKEWAVNENTLIGLDPDRILDSSTEPAWWNCPQCHHPYIMSPKNRLLKLKRGHNPCTFCNGRRIPSPRFIL